MTISSIGIKNVKRNFKNYISYFVSIFASVFILDIFFSIYFNNYIQSFSSGRTKVVTVFKMAAFVVIIFSAIFIWYSNEFFIKNKKKEVAIYSLVGMKKKDIGNLMFFENIFLGVLSIITAIPVGTITSTFFLKLLTRCIKSPTEIKYSFDIKSILMTILVFAIIFGFNSLKAYKVIYKFKLIELLHASKEGEKQPKYSKILALLSIVMILGGYIIVLTADLSTGGNKMMITALVVMVLVIAGIYILFNNFIIYIFKLIQKHKKMYYKGNNIIGISNIIYRIKGNSNLLATISIISAVAITALCFTFSFNMMLDDIVPSGCPFSLQYKSNDQKLNDKVEAVINNDKDNEITYKTDITLIDAKGFTEKYLGAFDKTPGIPCDIYIMSLSEYNDILENSAYNKGAECTDRATDINIPEKDDCFFIEVSKLGEVRERLKGEKLDVTFSDKSYNFNISDSDIKSVLGSTFQKTTIVVQDETFNTLKSENQNNITTIRSYNFKDPLKTKDLDAKLSKVIPPNANLASYYREYVELHSLYGSFIFIGIFLGILFVFSSGSIMYYKQLIEASEDKERYDTLFKIGLKKKEATQITLRQIGFVFITPLAFAVLNSIVALVVYVKYVSTGGASISYIVKCIIPMIFIYVAVYLMYYVLSVKSYMKIISNKNKMV